MITGVLIGAGQRGAEVYAKYALEHPNEFRIVAVAEPNPVRRAAFCAKHQIEEDLVFSDWKELLSKEKLADCALVCTMDKEHTLPVQAALEKGYHVLCEKPMSPDAKDCVAMGEYAKAYQRSLTVCHVLRYSPFFTKVKALLDTGCIGDIVCVQHLECVGYWHQAHSFVRGNWRNTAQSSPMILQKSCHDMDILLWLTDEHCISVSSFGSLKHFCAENAPEGASKRCLDGCKARYDCPYDAGKIYLDHDEWYSETIRKVVALSGGKADVAAALEDGPYGRCVYHCDNDVVDHQVVNLLLTNGVTASFTMSAFTGKGSRTMNIMGTRGQLLCDMEENRITHIDFLSGDTAEHIVKINASGHSGSDERFMRGFLRTVESDGAYAQSSAEDSVESHLVALAAEESRLTGRTIALESFKKLQRG